MPRKLSKNKGVSKDVSTRVPSIIGWTVESNVFRTLLEVAAESTQRKGLRLGFIRNPDYAHADGGMIIDPPPGFPHHDLSEAWDWTRKNQDRNDVQVIPFDVKSGLLGSTVARHPLYLVVLPRYPDYVCIMRANSFITLQAVDRVQTKIDDTSDPVRMWHRTEARTLDSFPEFLAPFAVHKDCLYTALQHIAKCSLGDEQYTNPSNSVTFHGWTVPKPRNTLHEMLRTTQENHAKSQHAICILQDVLGDKTVTHFDLLLNMLQPLVSDLILRDETTFSAYLIQHKLDNASFPKKEWFDQTTNWHFLFAQSEELLSIFPRTDSPDAAHDIDSLTVQLFDSNAAQDICQYVRAHGERVKTALRKKWALQLPNSMIYSEGNDNTGKLEEQSTDLQPEKTGRTGAWATSQELCHVLCDALNEQCYKLEKHVCVQLRGSPCADMLVVEHDWTASDIEAYRACRSLPAVLLGKPQINSTRAIPIRLISHYCQPGIPTAELLEPGREPSWGAPVCSQQPFLLVAGTGTVRPLKSRQPLPDQLVLLESGVTNWFVQPSNVFVKEDDDERSDAEAEEDVAEGPNAESEELARDACDNKDTPRKWTHLAYRVKDRNGKSTSLLQAAFLQDDATPLTNLYNVQDGAFLNYIDAYFREPTSDYVCSVEGTDGLLQRAWMHGARRTDTTVWASSRSRFFARILRALPKNTLPKPDAELKRAIEDETAKFMKEENIGKKIAGYRAKANLIENPEYGIVLATHLAQFGCNLKIHCDSCADTDDCRFFRPETHNALNGQNKCKTCMSKVVPCTFTKLAAEVEEELRTFQAFRRSVPCHRCWELGIDCDKRSGSCKPCEDEGCAAECRREMCILFDEPADAATCGDCNRAHADDGYQNITEHPRKAESA